jgi:hypothetical protein
VREEGLQQLTPAYYAWVCKGAQVVPLIAWDLAQATGQCFQRTGLEEGLEEVHWQVLVDMGS